MADAAAANVGPARQRCGDGRRKKLAKLAGFSERSGTPLPPDEGDACIPPASYNFSEWVQEAAWGKHPRCHNGANDG
jgi:hypothetical protein